MPNISRADFLSHADEYPTKDVPVPEFGDGQTLRIRCLSSSQRLIWSDAYAKSQAGEPGPDPTAVLITLGAIDDAGKALFQLQDVDALAEMRGDLIDRLATEVLDLSAMTEPAAKEAEGNSDATQSSDSPSDSASESDAASQS